MTLRVNLLFNTRNAFGLKHDGMLLNGAIAAFFPDTGIAVMHHTMSRPERADVNIFLETLNPVHLSYAKVNILIPNQEHYYDAAYDPFLPKLTVWCKTHAAEEFFRAKGAKTVFLGWSSIDAGYADEQDFGRALFLASSASRAAWIDGLVAAWTPEAPALTIVTRPGVQVNTLGKANVTVLNSYCSDKDIQELQQACGVHLCLSDAEGFGHFQNEARSTGASIIIHDIAPCNERELFDESYGAAVLTAEQAVEAACKVKPARLVSRDAYCTNHKAFLSNFQHVFYETLEHAKSIPSPTAPEVSALPSVSIVTPTNRPDWVRLACYCYLMTNYPRDKLEWVILDNSDGDDLAKIVAEATENDPSVKVYRAESSGIGELRNEAVRRAQHDVIVHMDDDDYYGPNSVLERVSALLSMGVDCVYCSVLPMYEPATFTSAMNVPPLNVVAAQRVSEATLCYRRSFWEEREFHFSAIVAEGEGFLHGRMERTADMDPTKVIVSMLHGKNTSSRCMPEGTQKENGCHFGLPDDIFILVSGLADAQA